eukprot:TRINITY_DN5034_c4_g1_i1.p1 TRINITY_DN5034_c4_g1~~TRINITY_DN5034_c4_g1_i1.p1  ORF type:complete len:509 (+),score=156.04 TRINITY_DN5034_c4_g1_i1:53-1528(+)
MTAARAVLLLALASAAAAFDPANTVNLTVEEFDDQVFGGQDKGWFIMFWAPWCGHCRRVKPIFADASREAKPGIRLGMVDCTNDNAKEICKRYGVSGYPALKYSVKGGDLITFDGGRDLASFQILMLRLAAADRYVQVVDNAAAEKMRKRNDLIHFVFCTPDGQPTPAVQWIALRGMGYLRCLYATLPVSSPMCGGKERLLIFNDAGVRQYVPENDAPDWHEGAGQEAALLWVRDNRYLVVDQIDQTNFHHLVGKAKRPWVCMFVASTEDAPKTQPILEVLRSVAASEEGSEYAFGRLDGTIFGEWVNDFASPDELPNLLLYQPREQLYVKPSDEVGAMLKSAVETGVAPDAMDEAIRNWLRSVTVGDLLPSYQGTAGHLFHALRAVGLGFVNPHLGELRKSLDSDVLFLSVLVMGLTVFCTLIFRVCCGVEYDDAGEMLTSAEQRARSARAQQAAVQGGKYDHSAATPPTSPTKKPQGGATRRAGRAAQE